MSELNLENLQKVDPLKRMVEKESGQEEFSPMDPPDAYKPPKLDEIPENELHNCLQKLIKEHKAIVVELDSFEKALTHIQQKGIDKEVDGKMRSFFSFFDQDVLAHSQKEEKALFPLLQKRLLENGEHSQGRARQTAVDMMHDDHSKTMQLAAVSFNFLGLAVRLPDPESRVIVLDAAVEQSKSLVELLRLHIFREENILFPLAHKYLTVEEFEEIEQSL